TTATGHTPLPSEDPAHSLIITDYKKYLNLTTNETEIVNFTYTITASYNGKTASLSGLDIDESWYREDPDVPTKTVVCNIDTGNCWIEGAITGTLKGKVTDKNTGTPIEGALIEANSHQTTTNSSGDYIITNLLPGNYTVTASKEGYYSSTATAEILANQTTTLNFQLTKDTTPPEISNITVSSITFHSAVISWNTNESSTSLVKYGTSPGNYTYSKEDTSYTTSHSITLTNLTPNTTYYFVVNSTDIANNSAQSTEHSFKTKELSNIVYVARDGTGDYNCDGTDDQVEINQAIAYINSIGGGTVHLKNGTFVISDSINLTSNLIFEGEGTDRTIIKIEDGSTKEHWATIVGDGISSTIIRNLTINGNKGNTNPPNKINGDIDAIRLYYSDNITVENVLISNFWTDGVEFSHTNNSVVRDCEIIQLGHEGLRAIYSNNITFLRNHVQSSGTGNAGIRIYESSNCVIESNYFNVNGFGILINPQGEVPCGNNTYRDNYIEGHYGLPGIALWPWDTEVSNETFIGNIIAKTDGSHDNFGHGIHLKTRGNASLKNIKIINNVISNAIKSGIYVEAGANVSNIVAKNNIIVNNNEWGIYGNIFSYYNDVWNNLNNYGGSVVSVGDISTDPLFVNSPYDFHLKSEAGRWNGSTWVKDNVTSPCIDAGDPNSSYSNETYPHGQRINLGAYGNTQEASKSPYHKIYLGIEITIHPDLTRSYPLPPKNYYGNLTLDENFSATPTSNPVTIVVNKFNTSLSPGEVVVNFTANTSNGNNVIFTVCSLKSNVTYVIKKDSSVFAKKVTNLTGCLSFNNSQWSEATFTIEEETSFGTLKGKVTDNLGQAIEGALIEANSHNTTTNSTGDYTLSLPVGNYTVTASKEGYNESTATAEILENQITILNFTLTKDTTPPTTTASAVDDSGTNYTFGTWISASYVNITLSCDDGSGSGCDTILYCTDTTNTCTPSLIYSGTVQITADGITYIRYKANDTAGNEESVKNQTIKIDRTPPTTLASAVDDSGTNYTFGTWISANYVNITLSASDSGSGSDTILYCIDTNNSCNPTLTYNGTPIQISNEGVQYVRYKANDTAGNEESTKNQTIMIDRTSPTISNITIVNITQISATITWQTDELASSLVKYGTISGNYTYFKENATLTLIHSITLTNLTPNTTYYFVVNSTDRANNSAQSTEQSFKTNATSYCGNGIRELGEECDGSDFGGKTCASYGYNAGYLTCSSQCKIITTNCYNTGTGGGGGGGGGGYIEKVSKITLTTNLAIYKVVVNLKQPKANPSIKIKEIEQLPKGIAKPQGTYKLFELNKTNFEDKDIKNVTVEFKVEKQWIESNNIATIYLARYGTKWEKYRAEKINESSNFTFYRAKLSNLSYLAIIGEKIAEVCEEGTKRCSNNNLEQCINNQWQIIESCEYGCNSSTLTCNPKPPEVVEKVCEEGAKRCSNNNLEQCINNSWQTIESCKYGCNFTTLACNPEPEKPKFDYRVIAILLAIIATIVAIYFKRDQISKFLTEKLKFNRDLSGRVSKVREKIKELKAKGIDISQLEAELEIVEKDIKFGLLAEAKNRLERMEKELESFEV
ncbi:MAG: hypothetical protein DRN81_04555, partial [Thermoproteota archaeon]